MSITFLEPSCGDGKILDELLQQSKNIQSKNIFGVDIDSVALGKAKQNLSEHNVSLQCGNFLSLDRKQLNLEMTDMEEKEKQTLVVLGGPPYTPKNLPERFIVHSIIDLKADIVVFILPKRCANDADDICKILNRTKTHDDDGDWGYTNSDLSNISFSFKDTTISQPSILQSWYKILT